MTPFQQGLAVIVLTGCVAYTIYWCILNWPTCERDGCHLSASPFGFRRSALGLRSLAMYCRFHARQIDAARRSLSRTET